MFADEDVISYLSSEEQVTTSCCLNSGSDEQQWHNLPQEASTSHINAENEMHQNYIHSPSAPLHNQTTESVYKPLPPPYPGGSNMVHGSCSTLSDAANFFNERSNGKLIACDSYDFCNADVESSHCGTQYANTFQEVREVTLCRHDNEPYGLRVEAIGNNFYVTYIVRQSAAACAGLKVGDELVRVNNHLLLNCSLSEVLTHIREAESCVNLAYKPRAVVARLREVVLQKIDGVLGLRLIQQNDGLYIDFVKTETAASYAGLKEGTQNKFEICNRVVL